MTKDKHSIDDLFREEDIPFDIETEVVNEPSKTKKRRFGVVPISVILVILLGLLYLADLNSERFYLTVSNGSVEVEKGIFFPIGTSSFHPNVAYQSLELPEQMPEIPTDALSAEDRDHLLRDLLVQKAGETLRNADDGNLDRAREIFMLSYKLEYGQPTIEQQENFLGQYNLRKMYSNIGKIHSLLSMAQRNADRARTQGIKNAGDWLQVIDKALSDLNALAKRDKVDLSLFDPNRKSLLQPDVEQK